MINPWEWAEGKYPGRHKEPARYYKIISLSANQQTTEQVKISSGVVFVLFLIRTMATSVSFEAGISISNKALQDALIPGAIWGNWQSTSFTNHFTNCYEPFPIEIQGGKTIDLTVKDTSGASNTVKVVFEGIHVW